MALILTVIAVFVFLVACEFWWKHRIKDDEFSRKFIHITVGSFVAFWPFFLPWWQIELLGVAFLIVVFISKYLKLFEAIHSVQRPTWGEAFFAMAVTLVAVATHNKWVYLASILQMSLADGFAAVIGTRFGHKHKYLVFDYPKSVAGTLTFFVISLAILIVLNDRFPDPLSPVLIGATALGATVIENLAVKGLDNLLVPLLVALVLANV